MERTTPPESDPAVERLAGELAEVEASIVLVSSGVASRVTLTGLRFGQPIVDRLSADAANRGVDVEASFWPEDDVADVSVSMSTTTNSPAQATSSAKSHIDRE
jgi:hypothetical protein